MMNTLNMVTLLVGVMCHNAASNPTVVYSWVRLEYDWPNDTMRQDYIAQNKYVVKNNLITGLKLYNDQVYLTVPRWRHGVPSTLNRVVVKNGSAVLQPYPSWADQTVGDCSALQYVQSMEIDPHTGIMWVIDNGRIDFIDPHSPTRNICPPKLVLLDMKSGGRRVHTYTFPQDVANRTSCFLNDIVLDYVNGDAVKFAYVTDTRDAKMYVYDVERDSSYFFTDPSMKPSDGGPTPIDGIAMSARFDFVYYCPISGLGLFQIPTAVLRQRDTTQFHRHVRRVGTRVSRSDGLAYGQRALYYGLVDDVLGVQSWDVDTDAAAIDSVGDGFADVTMMTQERVVSGGHDDVRLRWVDTLAWDETGHLWFTANNLASFMAETMDFSDAAAHSNMFVWKVFVNDSSYLSRARSHAQPIVG